MGASYVDMTQKIGINDDLSRLCEQSYICGLSKYTKSQPPNMPRSDLKAVR